MVNKTREGALAPCFDFGRAAGTLAGMQTATVAPSASEIAALDFGPFEPFLNGSHSKALGRSRGYPTLPDDGPTEEEKFIALKAAIDEGIAQIDSGQVIEIPHGELRNYIRQLGEEASRRLRE